MAYRRVDTDPDPDSASVRRLTFVPFLANGNCVAITQPDERLALPTGDVQPGEHWLLDATLRIPLMTAGYFRQRVHPVAVDDLDDGLHLYVFAEGALYTGTREHVEVDLTELTAEELATRTGDERLAQVVRDAAESFRTQSEESFYADNTRLLEPVYLRAETPEGGSGSGSTPEGWRARRGQIADGIERDGTFLDLGCANGHLMDSIHRWTAERGLAIEPHGVDIAPGLVALARKRLPQWADRIHEGNALSWTHPDGLRFTYVHLLLDFGPQWRRADLLRHALDNLVEPGGRLLVSHYVRSQKGVSAAHEMVEALGWPIAGGSGETVWIDKDVGADE